TLPPRRKGRRSRSSPQRPGNKKTGPRPVVPFIGWSKGDGKARHSLRPERLPLAGGGDRETLADGRKTSAGGGGGWPQDPAPDRLVPAATRGLGLDLAPGIAERTTADDAVAHRVLAAGDVAMAYIVVVALYDAGNNIAAEDVGVVEQPDPAQKGHVARLHRRRNVDEAAIGRLGSSALAPASGHGRNGGEGQRRG